MPRKYNSLKLNVLRALQDAPHSWLTPVEVAHQIRFRPVRSMWSYLLHLHRWGLLLRRSEPYIEYCLSERGSQRLAWLECPHPK
jgi:hypothetical protein